MKNLKDAILDNLKNNFSVNHTEKDAQIEINKYYESIKYLFNDDEVYVMYKAITEEDIKEIQEELDARFKNYILIEDIKNKLYLFNIDIDDEVLENDFLFSIKNEDYDFIKIKFDLNNYSKLSLIYFLQSYLNSSSFHINN